MFNQEMMISVIVLIVLFVIGVLIMKKRSGRRPNTTNLLTEEELDLHAKIVQLFDLEDKVEPLRHMGWTANDYDTGARVVLNRLSTACPHFRDFIEPNKFMVAYDDDPEAIMAKKENGLDTSKFINYALWMWETQLVPQVALRDLDSYLKDAFNVMHWLDTPKEDGSLRFDGWTHDWIVRCVKGKEWRLLKRYAMFDVATTAQGVFRPYGGSINTKLGFNRVNVPGQFYTKEVEDKVERIGMELFKKYVIDGNVQVSHKIIVDELNKILDKDQLFGPSYVLWKEEQKRPRGKTIEQSFEENFNAYMQHNQQR